VRAADVAGRYFEAIARQDLDAAAGCWREGGIDNLAPVGELRVPDEWRAYFSDLFAAFPDFRYEVLSTVAEGDLVAVHWRASGRFTGASYQGIRPTGGRADAGGLDLVRVEDGKIVRLDSYWDDASVTRQLGLLPPRGSRQEKGLVALFNLRTRLRRRST
jgi:predicted ester cyclase